MTLGSDPNREESNRSMPSRRIEASGLPTRARNALARFPGVRNLKLAFAEALASAEERPLLQAYGIGMTQNRAEITPLAGLVRRLHPTRVLEIGTAAGGTLFLWTRLASSDATLISVDLPQVGLSDSTEATRLDLCRSFRRKGQV